MCFNSTQACVLHAMLARTQQLWVVPDASIVPRAFMPTCLAASTVKHAHQVRLDEIPMV